MKLSLKKQIGNALIALSFFMFIFTFYPIIKMYLFPQNNMNTAVDNSFHIEIPKIKVRSQIIENVNPFDAKEYNRELKKGIAHAKNTALPGENGSIFLFAHSSGPPWEISRYNTIFFKLGELENGDRIILRKDKKEYKYQVYDKKEVFPSEVKYLKEKENILILQTCTPIGTDFKRLLIFSKPIL